MISPNPVMADRSLEDWLLEGGFPPGFVKAALLVTKVPPPEDCVLEGHLLYVTKGGKGKGEKNVGQILASLHPHAEVVIFSPGCRVPDLLRIQHRLEQNEDGKTELDLMEEADILVLSGVSHLAESERHLLDNFVSRRGHRAPRITVLIVEDRKAALPQAEEVYGEGRITWV